MKKSTLVPLALLAAALVFLWPAAGIGAQGKAVGSKLRLEYLMTFHADLVQPVDIGQTAVGHRQVLSTSGGTFTGPKLQGKILPGPVDWFVQGAEGVAHPDVRGTFQTDDGANIYVRYQGTQVWNEAAGAKMAKGNMVDYSDIYWVVSPLFETGDPHYAWLNNIVAVAEGRLGPNGSWVEYRIFQVLD